MTKDPEQLHGPARPDEGLADVPLPGRPVRGSSSGQPLMALLDLLGRRWTLRILWELRDGPLGFAALRGACDGMSQSMLTTRLRELQVTGLVDTHHTGGYRRTTAGDELGVEMLRLNRWADRWAQLLEAGYGTPQTPAATNENSLS